MDLAVLIAANGEDYLPRRIVDRAVCSACGGEEIAVTLGVESAPGYSYPDYGNGRMPP